MKLVLLNIVAMAFFTAAVSCADTPRTPGDITKQIADLSSDDGMVRVAATKALFAAGTDALEPLAKAGAKQISPLGSVGTKRIDVVYSLIDGLKPNEKGARAGYRANGFGLQVEKGCNREDMVKMGEKYGFTFKRQVDDHGKPIEDFNTDGTPACYVQLAPGKKLEDVLKALLSEEPAVISISLNYFET